MAVVFNGTSDYIDCGSSTGLNFIANAQMSMSMWISIPSLSAPATAGTFCGRGYDGTSTAYGFGTDNASAGFTWSSFSGATPHGYATGAVGGPILYSALAWSVNQFHHVYGQYDGAQWKLAFDGSFSVSPVTDHGEYNVPTAKFLIGAVDIGGTPGQFAAACLADVAVYNGLLTTGEVTALGNGSLRPNLSMSQTLLGYWKLDTAAATQTDFSGNGNTGTAFSGAITNTCANSPPYVTVGALPPTFTQSPILQVRNRVLAY